MPTIVVYVKQSSLVLKSCNVIATRLPPVLCSSSLRQDSHEAIRNVQSTQVAAGHNTTVHRRGRERVWFISGTCATSRHPRPSVLLEIWGKPETLGKTRRLLLACAPQFLPFGSTMYVLCPVPCRFTPPFSRQQRTSTTAGWDVSRSNTPKKLLVLVIAREVRAT